MATDAPNRTPPAPRHFSIQLRRPMWIRSVLLVLSVMFQWDRANADDGDVGTRPREAAPGPGRAERLNVPNVRKRVPRMVIVPAVDNPDDENLEAQQRLGEIDFV